MVTVNVRLLFTGVCRSVCLYRLYSNHILIHLSTFILDLQSVALSLCSDRYCTHKIISLLYPDLFLWIHVYCFCIKLELVGFDEARGDTVAKYKG